MMIHVAVGYRYLGRTSAVDGEAIYTRFFVIGLPLYPVESIYGRCGENGTQGLSIPLNAWSVFLACLQSWGLILAGLAALGCKFISEDTGQRWVAALAIVIFAPWLWAMLLAGRVSSVQARQRRLMGVVVGTSVDPCALSPDMLQSRLDQAHLSDIDVERVRRLLDHAPADSLRPLFVAAAYKSCLVGQSDWKELAQALWHKVAALDDNQLLAPIGKPALPPPVMASLPPITLQISLAIEFPLFCCRCLHPTAATSTFPLTRPGHLLGAGTPVQVPTCPNCCADERRTRRMYLGGAIALGILVGTIITLVLMNAGSEEWKAKGVPGSIIAAAMIISAMLFSAFASAFFVAIADTWRPHTVKFTLIRGSPTEMRGYFWNGAYGELVRRANASGKPNNLATPFISR